MSHVIDPAYYDVIRELKAEGITFCACSGRQYYSMMKLFEPVADDIYFISANGTVVRTRDRVLHSWTIDPELYLPVIQKLRTIEGSEIVVEGVEKSWIEGYETPVTKLMRDQYHYSVENVPDLDALASERIVKISLHHPNVEEATKDLFRSRRLEKLSMTISGAAWLDIISPEAGKGETVYFGDNLNDLSAFHEAGVAATVANARQEMHDAADIVASSFSDLGVLRQLRHILDLEKRFKAEGNI